jgi:hypothetical protein
MMTMKKRRHDDDQKAFLFDYAFWGMALAYVIVVVAAWFVAGALIWAGDLIASKKIH